MKITRHEPNHPQGTHAFTPKEKALAWLGLAACAVMGAVVEALQPSLPPFTGRWAWLHAWVHGALGVRGLSVLFAGMAAACGIAAWAYWLHSRAPRAR